MSKHQEEQGVSNDEIMEFRKNHFLATAVNYHKKPLQLVKAKGQYVWDNEGNQYLDAVGGIVCISAGHNHDRIKSEMKKMIDSDAIQHTSYLYLNRYVVDATRSLIQESPEGVDRVHFTNSGSEANELAFLAARQKTGETMIVNLRHSYHGGTSGALAQCGHHNWRFRAQPVSSVTSAEAPYCYRCPFGKKKGSCNLECADNVKETIETSTHGKIAAMIVEPVMGVGGFLDAPKEYFHKVADIVHEFGGYYISDEVQTGAGRCGEDMFVTRSLGIDADMITMAKGLGNGAAVGAVMMKTEISDSMAGKLHFNTFGGDPYQTMQAKVTFDIIREENLIENAKVTGKRLKDGLVSLQKKYGLIGDVRGRGLLLGVELVKDRKTKEFAPEETAEIMDLCRDNGLLVGKGGLRGNVLRLAPPLNITEKDVDDMLIVMDRAFHTLTEERAKRGISFSSPDVEA
jgi:4-aminobutyrate aminotransferase-like enzyme